VPVAFDEVQHHQDVGDETLGARVEGAPADRGRNPQAVLAVSPGAARAGADVVGDALLVDPQEPLGLSGLQGEGDQVAGLGDERMQAPPGRCAGLVRVPTPPSVESLPAGSVTRASGTPGAMDLARQGCPNGAPRAAPRGRGRRGSVRTPERNRNPLSDRNDLTLIACQLTL
jgi:hypothetical protein